MMNIIIFGAPGSGKGTQSKKLIERYNLEHISTGNILREEIEKGTELGLHAKDIIEHGNLMPDDVMIEIIENVVKNHHKEKGFLFDGFPRTITQAEALEEIMAKNDEKVLCTISLNVPQEELVRRILDRGKGSGRKDDSIKIIEQRLNEYNNKTVPVADFYKKLKKLHEVKGVKSIDDVFNKIVDIIESLKS